MTAKRKDDAVNKGQAGRGISAQMFKVASRVKLQEYTGQFLCSQSAISMNFDEK